MNYLIDVEDSILAGIEGLLVRNKEQPWFDGLFIAEYAESLFGALLTSCQAYCVGTIADMNELRSDRGGAPLTKLGAYAQFPTSRGGYTMIELINSGANCFKHRDEWGESWPDNHTTKTLKAYSITKDSEFPLNLLDELIRKDAEAGRITSLLSKWRAGLLAASISNGYQGADGDAEEAP